MGHGYPPPYKWLKVGRLPYRAYSLLPLTVPEQQTLYALFALESADPAAKGWRYNEIMARRVDILRFSKEDKEQSKQFYLNFIYYGCTILHWMATEPPPEHRWVVEYLDYETPTPGLLNRKQEECWGHYLWHLTPHGLEVAKAIEVIAISTTSWWRKTGFEELFLDDTDEDSTHETS